MVHWRGILSGLAGAALLAGVAGCPTPLEFVAGTTGDTGRLGTVASVTVVSPTGDLSITGGTPIEVNWRVVATTNFSSVDIIFDVDEDPENGNEILSLQNLPITQSTALLDTSRLSAGTYLIGVLLYEQNELSEFAYATGRVTVNQRPQFFFTSPRDNFTFDRSNLVVPRFDVAWQIFDPDSTVSVEIFLDPDGVPNGNELKLRDSTNQTGDSFSFDLPTGLFEPGLYRLLAVVSDGTEEFLFYSPASIRIRARLAGMIDLRLLDDPASGELAGAVFEGFNPGDNAGSFVSNMRDLDLDGFSDFIILSQFGKPQFQANIQRTGVGEAYVVYGRSNRFSGFINLNSTGTLFRGEVLTGVPEAQDPIRPSRGISSVAPMSDWDGDGLREIAFGLPFTDSLPVGALGAGTEASGFGPLDTPGYFRSGVVVVASSSVFRPDLGHPGRSVINLAEIGTVGHSAIELDPGCAEGFYGPKAASGTGAGTFFHHHLVDVVGTPNIGSVRLGCRYSSNDPFDQFGEVVSAGEFDSIIFSAPNRDPLVGTISNNIAGTSFPGAGVVSIFYVNVINGWYPWNNDQAPPATDSWPGLGPSPDALIPHRGPYHYIVDDYRIFLSVAGPLDEGTFPIARTGSPGYHVDPDDGPDCEATVDGDSPVPQRTVRIWSSTTGAALSNAVGIADFNADGLQDILIGSPLNDNAAGACYIVFGRIRELVMAGELEIEELGLPSGDQSAPGTRIFDGIRVVGAAGDRLGQSQAGAGDFNNDGIADVVIGSPLINGRRGGAAVFFGSRDVINLTQEAIPFAEIPERDLGVIFAGDAEGDLAGARVANAGDVDGDGITDILIAAPSKSVRADLNLDGIIDVDRTNCGVVYLIYGSPDLRGTIPLADVGTERLPGAVFVGRNSGSFLGAGLGQQGDRSNGIASAGDVDGDGFGDLLMSSVSASPRNRATAGEAYLLYGSGD